jgi:mannose-6-phosphate isomerase-like protein (cupin superfamily)
MRLAYSHSRKKTTARRYTSTAPATSSTTFCDEFYYILYGEFTVWWGKDASNLDEFYELKEGDCAYYPTGWKYKVKNTGTVPGKFFFYMSEPRSGVQRLDHAS